MCWQQHNYVVEQKIVPAGFNFEKKGHVQMVVGVNTCLRGFGRSTFPPHKETPISTFPPHACMRSLALPSVAKPSQGMAGMA